MIDLNTRFADRTDAGRRLATRLTHLRDEAPIVLALPRGGVVVGHEIARALAAPLDIIAVRKIGAPHHPEFAIGALADGRHPQLLLDDAAVREVGVSRSELRRAIRVEWNELRRRERLYRGAEPRLDLQGRTVIVVDDGIATGCTIRAALRALRRSNPRRLILATPVAPPETLALLCDECDEIVCLLQPAAFHAVALYYDDFEQTIDQEVVRLLEDVQTAPPE